MTAYIKLLRPMHWIKNTLIFLPLLTSHNLFNTALLARTCIGTVIYCLLSSVVYICNDIMDADNDRYHKTKCNRPIASGAVTPFAAKTLLSVLLFLIILAGIFTFGKNIAAWAVLTVYFGLNIAYSVKLKHIALADIFILASGYTLRVYFCSALTNIDISKWLFLTLISGALFMALGKRRGEMRKQGDNALTRKVLVSYTDAFLDKTMYMCEAITIIFYSLWSVDSVTITQSNNGNIIFTVPFILAIFLRYNLLLERDTDGDPINTLIGDKPLLALCGVFIIVLMVLLYIHV